MVKKTLSTRVRYTCHTARRTEVNIQQIVHTYAMGVIQVKLLLLLS